MTDPRDTIRKLLAVAHDPAATDGEVQNAFRLARRLMIRHDLSEEQLAEEDIARVAQATSFARRSLDSLASSVETWESGIANAVDILHSTNHYISTRWNPAKKKKTGIITHYGATDAVDLAVPMTIEWIHIVHGLARSRGGCFRGAGRDYARGFAMGMIDKARAIIREERERVRDLPASSPYAIAIVNTHAIARQTAARAQQWLRDEQGVRLRSSSPRAHTRDLSGYDRGLRDGRASSFAKNTPRSISG